MSSDVPRNPDHYHPSDHAVIRKKERGMPWDAVADTLRTGEVRHTHRSDVKKFVADLSQTERPVAVAANIKTGEITTVYWEDGQTNWSDEEQQ